MDSIVLDNISCVARGISLLERMDDDLYTASLEASHGAAIGGHMRHNIDHYRSLLDRPASGHVDYDARERNPLLETSSRMAMEALEKISSDLAQLEGQNLDASVLVKTDTGSHADGADAIWGSSSLRRELQFLISHTIHHYALIGVICRLRGFELPDDFGVAPSTILYRAQTEEASEFR